MIRTTIALTAAIALAMPLYAAARVGAPAPDFTATDSNGKPVRLSSLKGKTVVLEWHNPGCPFVQKHYQGNMQKTQAAANKAGVVWLTVNSGAPGKQGHMDGAAANALVKKSAATPDAYLIDSKGTVGKAYGARTTPEMVLIDAKGTLVYQGAIDDKPTADVADIKIARNHLLAALGELKAGKAITVPSSKPYGCTVKYAS
jgi:peroxiredoxin